MKKIKIAFCLRDMQMGGVESVLIRTLDGLQKYDDIDISMITYVDVKEPVYKKYFEQHQNVKCYSLYPSRFFGTQLPHFFLSRLFVHVLRDIYRGFKRTFVMRKFKDIDVFIDYHDFCFHDDLKHIKHAKKIAWFHSSINVFIKRKFINKLKHYDNVVVLTDACKNDLNNFYPKYSDKIIRIYNPIDIENVRAKATKKSPISGKYFCCVSRLSGDKDIKTILDAFDDFYLINNKPNVKMVFVGNGDKADEYKNYAKCLKSSKQIIFTGMQENPFVYMNYALANILSSYGEGFPSVLVESSCLETLNIASDCKYGPRENLLDGRGGMLFKPGDSKQLAKLLCDVYTKKIDINSMIKESTNALNRFDKDIIIKDIISLIS